MTEKETSKISIATIGATAYNWIAIQAGPRSADEILAGINAEWARANWGEEVTAERLREALAVMLSKRIVILRAAVYDVRDQQRRVVVARDRTDKIGWNGWVVAKRDALKRLPIEVAAELD